MYVALSPLVYELLVTPAVIIVSAVAVYINEDNASTTPVSPATVWIEKLTGCVDDGLEHPSKENDMLAPGETEGRFVIIKFPPV